MLTSLPKGGFTRTPSNLPAYTPGKWIVIPLLLYNSVWLNSQHQGSIHQKYYSQTGRIPTIISLNSSREDYLLPHICAKVMGLSVCLSSQQKLPTRKHNESVKMDKKNCLEYVSNHLARLMKVTNSTFGWPLQLHVRPSTMHIHCRPCAFCPCAHVEFVNIIGLIIPSLSCQLHRWMHVDTSEVCAGLIDLWFYSGSMWI